MKHSLSRLAAGLAAMMPSLAFAETAVPQHTNVNAIVMFLVFVAMSLGITYWAAGRTKSTSDFLAAGGSISGFKNGLAITGDWASSAALMGIAALIYTTE
jgi:cation/acetate symporter